MKIERFLVAILFILLLTGLLSGCLDGSEDGIVISNGYATSPEDAIEK